ncbi:hypothetical protein ABPG73_021214 [Tetrahymena malaccensis]
MGFFFNLIIIISSLKLCICEQCQVNEIYSITTQSCLKCSDNCLKCFNINEDSCINCQQNLFKSSINSSTCVKQCQEGEFLNENQQCVKCRVFGCVKCDAQQKCYQCDQNLELDQDTNMCVLMNDICPFFKNFIQGHAKLKQCQQECSPNFYQNMDAQICEETVKCIQIQESQRFSFDRVIIEVQSINQNQYLISANGCTFAFVDSDWNIISVQILQDLLDYDDLYISNGKETNRKSFIIGDQGGCTAGSRLVVMDFKTQKILFAQENTIYDYYLLLADQINQAVFLSTTANTNTFVWYDAVNRNLNSLDIGFKFIYFFFKFQNNTQTSYIIEWQDNSFSSGNIINTDNMIDNGYILLIADLINLEITQKYNIIQQKVMNIVNDPFKQLIYIVNNEGITDIFSYTLKYIASIQNRCLKQAIISYDINFVYSICPNDIIVYNGISFEQQFPPINYGFSEVSNLINMSYNNYLIVVSKNKLSIIQLKFNDTFTIVYEYNQENVYVNNFQLLKDANNQTYASLIISNFKNISQIQLPLTQNNLCSVRIDQQNRISENIYTKNNLDSITQSLQSTSQILSLIEIVYLDGEMSLQVMGQINLNLNNTMKYYSMFNVSLNLNGQFNLQNFDKNNTILQIQEQDVITVQYLCDTLFLNEVDLLNSVDAKFNIQANSIYIQDLSIKDIETSSTVFNMQADKIIITNINIVNIKPKVQGLKLNFINIQSFTDTQITNIKSNNSQISLLSINQQKIGGNAIVSQIMFMDIFIFEDNPLLSFNQLQQIILENILIKNVVNSDNQYSSIFYIQNCETVKIIDSQFTNNTNSNGPGGVIYAIENKQITIQNSTFWLNTCQQQNGGAIYISNKIILGVLFIDSSQFIENKALLSSGGAIYQQNINIKIHNSEISSNQAQIGGGIYYSQIIPDFLIDLYHGNSQNNTFKHNVGHIYGQNFGSTLRKVQIDIENIEVPKGSIKSYADGDIYIYDFKSGDQINFKKIQLLDEEGNPTKFDNLGSNNQNQLSSDVQSLIQQISISLGWDQQNEQVQCIGQLQTKQFSDGGYSLAVQLFYKPIANTILKIQSNIFPQLKDSQGNIIVNAGQVEMNVKIYLDQCSVGEIFTQYGNSIACEQCPEGKYSLSLNDKECKECPDSAVSCIGSNIQLKNGYWRENENTDNILYCNLNPLPCQPQLSTSKFNCNEGYKGPLCQCCDVYGDIWGESYAQMFNPGYCNKCSQNKTKIIAYNLFIFILISSYVLFILKRIIMQLEAKIMGYYLNKLDMIYFGSTLNQSDRSQIISKILTDHLQILSFVCTFTVNMPVSLTLPIQISGNTFNMTSKSIDCIFSNYPNLQPLWLYQSLWSFSLPLGISFLYLLIGIIFNFFKINIFIKYLRTAALFIYFYFFPMVINLASRSINCISIGNKKYLDLDLTVNCFDVNKHKPYILFYSLPVIIIWGILIPIYLFYKIHSTKQKNKSIFITIKYSFFFAGYKDKYYYWEFWKLFYKANLIFISELLKQNIYIKVGIMNLALLFQFYLLVKSKPFVREYFNNLQQKSIVLCAFSLNLCFILIVGDQNGLAYQMALILLVTFANLFYIFILLIGLSRLLIPTQKQDRNIIQNIIFQIKKKYPQLLDVQLQNKQKIKSLLKLNKVKCKIKQLMKYLKVYDFYSSQSLQSFFNIKKNQDVSISPQAQQFNQNLSSEISDEKHLLFKNSNSIKKLRNKWSYYTRNTKSNQISLRTSNLNFFPNNYEKDDQVMETQNSIQIVKNSSNIKFQIQLSDHQN